MKKLFFLLVIAGMAASCGGGAQSDSAEDTAMESSESSNASESTASQTSDDGMVANLRNALRNDLLKEELEYIPQELRRFSYAASDLNGDGRDEYLVGLQNSHFCGSGGCTYLLLDHEGMLVTRFTVSDAPFIPLAEKTNGWNDLVVESDGNLRLLKFDGKSYPSNPSVAPEYSGTPSAQLPRLLSHDPDEEFTF